MTGSPSDRYTMGCGWADHPALKPTGKDPVDKRRAFVWLHENAATGPREVIGRYGETITLCTGQLNISNRQLGQAWEWPEAKVRRFLNQIEAAKLIARRADAHGNLITIRNFVAFSAAPDVSDAQEPEIERPKPTKSDAHEQPPEPQECEVVPLVAAKSDAHEASTDPRDDGKLFDLPLPAFLDRREPSDGDIDAEFEAEFWPDWPIKTDKQAAKAAYRKARKKVPKEDILDGRDRYIESKPAGQQWKYAQGWLNGERWTDGRLDVDCGTEEPRRRAASGSFLEGAAGFLSDPDMGGPWE